MTVLLFVGECYYAKGGMNDFQGAYGDLGAALTALGDIDSADWWQLICQETLDVLAQSALQAHGCDEDNYCPQKDCV